MLHISTNFTDSAELLPLLDADDSFFRYSTFSNMSLNGGHITASFVNCTFRELDWYWGVFNLALLVECRFERCLFHGTAFMGCKFVECSFQSCRFGPDNLDRDCSYEKTKWYGCRQTDTAGLPKFN